MMRQSLAETEGFRISFELPRPMSKASSQSGNIPHGGTNQPAYRPSDRFWPYVGVSEEPTAEELAILNPDLRRIVLGETSKPPFSVTVIFPRFDGDDYERAVELAKDSTEYFVSGTGSGTRHRARFRPHEALKLRALFELVGALDLCDVLIDDRAVPYARELWLPLFWFLIR